MPDALIVIRTERAEDADAISAVTMAAFATMEFSNQTEHFIVDALRAAGALTLSLVAAAGDRIVGHIAFSPVTMSDGTDGWYGLGPVSVLPLYQRTGIGSALIEDGLARLRALGARGCCVVGHPQYYGRFGFEHVVGLACAGVPPEAFFALPFDGHLPQGTVVFHAAFALDAPPGSDR